jgi:WD40 repeat protein
MRATCSKCGNPIPEQAPSDLCLPCLLAGLNASTEPDPAPSTFGPYALGPELGAGSGGRVYRAHDPELRRDVTLKILVTPPGTEAGRRFRAGAEATAQLSHPHIVPVHAVGEHQGQLYLALQYVEGCNLSQLLARRLPLSDREAVALLLPIVDAVHHAHSRGILHRDLKPANILVDESGTPYLTDFGIAKFLHSPHDITVTSTILGTANYMAPEQALGRNIEVTTVTDVYGLGAILFELLTGQPPFVGNSFADILRKVAEDEPRPPRQLRESIDLDLETICLRCLRKRPIERYPSAAELATDLRRWLDGMPVSARRLSRLEQARRWARRHPARASLLGVSLIALAALTAAAFNWNRNREGLQRQRLLDAQRRNFNYVVDLQLANNAWRSGTLARMANLLDAQQTNPGQSDLRGLEWYLLRSWLDLEPATLLLQLDSPITAIAPSPDRTRVAALTRTHLHLVNLAEPLTASSIPLPDSIEPQAIDLAADGHIAIASPLGSWLLSSTASKPVLVDTNPANCVAFDPTGTTLASGRSPRIENDPPMMLRLRRLTDGKAAERLQDAGLAFRWKPDRPELLIALVERGAGIWDPTAHSYTEILPPSGTMSLHATWSSSGRFLARVDAAGTVSVEDSTQPSKQPRARLPGHSFRGISIAFSPSDSRCAIAGGQDAIAIYDTATWTVLHRLRGHRSDVTSLTFPTDDTLVSSGRDGFLRLWTLPPPSQTPGLTLRHRMKYYVGRTLFSPDARWLALPLEWRTDRETSTVVQIAGKSPPVPVPGLIAGFLDRSRYLAWDRSTQRWTIGSTESPGTYSVPRPAHHPEASQGLLSRDASTLALRDLSDHVVVIRMSDGSILGRSESPASTFSLSSDGKVVGLVHPDSITRWEPLSRITRSIPYQAEEVALSPDGTALAAAGKDQRVLLLADPDSKPEFLIGHGAPVQSVAFSDDAQTLFSASQDGAIRAWQMATRRELMTWEHPQAASWLSVAPGNVGLLVGTQAPSDQTEGSFWFWPAAGNRSESSPTSASAAPQSAPLPAWLRPPTH